MKKKQQAGNKRKKNISAKPKKYHIYRKLGKGLSNKKSITRFDAYFLGFVLLLSNLKDHLNNTIEIMFWSAIFVLIIIQMILALIDETEDK